MKLLSSVVAGVLSLSIVHANAATDNLSIIINSPPSTSVTCPIAYPTGQTAFVSPVAAGTKIASCSVLPSTWSGVLVLSGPDVSLFALSGQDVVVGSTPLTADRTYNVTVTSTP